MKFFRYKVFVWRPTMNDETVHSGIVPAVDFSAASCQLQDYYIDSLADKVSEITQIELSIYEFKEPLEIIEDFD